MTVRNIQSSNLNIWVRINLNGLIVYLQKKMSSPRMQDQGTNENIGLTNGKPKKHEVEMSIKKSAHKSAHKSHGKKVEERSPRHEVREVPIEEDPQSRGEVDEPRRMYAIRQVPEGQAPRQEVDMMEQIPMKYKSLGRGWKIVIICMVGLIFGLVVALGLSIGLPYVHGLLPTTMTPSIYNIEGQHLSTLTITPTVQSGDQQVEVHVHEAGIQITGNNAVLSLHKSSHERWFDHSIVIFDPAKLSGEACSKAGGNSEAALKELTKDPTAFFEKAKHEIGEYLKAKGWIVAEASDEPVVVVKYNEKQSKLQIVRESEENNSSGFEHVGGNSSVDCSPKNTYHTIMKHMENSIHRKLEHTRKEGGKLWPHYWKSVWHHVQAHETKTKSVLRKQCFHLNPHHHGFACRLKALPELFDSNTQIPTDAVTFHIFRFRIIKKTEE